MLKDLIVKLMEGANEEAEHKGWCDTYNEQHYLHEMLSDLCQGLRVFHTYVCAEARSCCRSLMQLAACGTLLLGVLQSRRKALLMRAQSPLTWFVFVARLPGCCAESLGENSVSHSITATFAMFDAFCPSLRWGVVLLLALSVGALIHA